MIFFVVLDKIYFMRIGIISDTHDNWNFIKKALEILKKENINTLIHCGDICAPITLEYIAKSWNKEFHFCFGNVDGDRYLMQLKVERYKNIKCHGEVLGTIKIKNKNIAFQHFPQIGESLAYTGKYDAVFYGHTHIKDKKFIKIKNKKVLLANPGNLCAIKAPPSFCIYNLDKNDIKFIEL